METIKKELLDRLFYLNKTTGAIDNKPHKIHVDEIEKEIRKRKKEIYVGYGIAFILLGIFELYVFFNDTFGKFMSVSGIVCMLLMISIVGMSRVLRGFDKLNEQRFIIELMNKIENDINKQ
ncbi:MAG: hypothetical protein AABZ32_04660 [Bacteroidota bacterium]